ncbi:MAG: TonB-dependent receptor, partial [Lentisphaeraceae bacterium]|nr:TonB-dependent receptor [Lentisphaeraceae bacterium]
PTYHWDGAMRLGIAEYDTMQKAIAFGGPLIDGTLAFRIAYDDQSTDGTITSTELDSDKIDQSYSKNFRAKLLWDATDDLSFLLTYTNLQTLSGDGSVNAADPFSRKVTDVRDKYLDFTDVETNSFSLETNYEIDENWSFTSISAFSKQDYEAQSGFINATLFGFLDGPPEALTSERVIEDETLTQEFRISYDNDGDLRAVAGLYLAQHENSDVFHYVEGLHPNQIYGGLFPGGVVPSGPQGEDDYTRDVSTYSLFGELDYDVNELWTMNVGGRVVHEEVDSDISLGNYNPLEALARRVALIGPTASITSSASDKQTELVFLPKFGLTLHATDNIDVNATIKRGYRAGGLASKSDPTGVGTDVVSYDPEFTWNYELALRSHWLESQLFVNANIFYTDYEDMQVYERVQVQGSPTSLSYTTNAGSAHTYGAELEVIYRPRQIEGLNLYANLGILKTKYDEYNNGMEDFSGNEFEDAPELSWNAGISYQHKSGLYGSIEALYQSSAYQWNDNEFEIDQHVIVDAKLGYKYNDQYSVYLYAKNLLNEKYFASVSTSTSNPYATVGLPQTFGVVFDYKF